MRRLFADTFYYLALLSPADEAHASAVELTHDYGGEMVTTDFVLMEVADGLASARTRRAAVALVDALHRDPAVRIIPATRRLFERASRMYRARSDKNWSMTDCTSFLVMRDLKLSEALTADHHFKQAGFVTLL
ncbi:MAG TPA: PIN domain-containing protein [Tepidisphaeraceae bacterium]|jgi:hypothetical protein